MARIGSGLEVVGVCPDGGERDTSRVSVASAARAAVAYRAQLDGPGVLSVRAGWKFTGGWPVDPPTPAVVVTVTRKGSDPPGGVLLAVRVGGVPVDVRQAAPVKAAALTGGSADPGPLLPEADPTVGGLPVFADETTRSTGAALDVHSDSLVAQAASAKPQLPYIPPLGVPLAPVSGSVTVQAAASPDAGWPVLEAFLSGVQQTLTVGMYDWTSAHILATVTSTLAGRTFNLVLDHPALNPSADQTDDDTVTALHTALGAGLRQVWALERDDPHAAAWIFPSAYHIKVAVADHQRVWLSSGNWNNSNQPDIDPVTNPGDATVAQTSDRDWHVVIDSADLAATFEAYLLNDLTVAAAHQQPAATAPIPAPTTENVPTSAPGTGPGAAPAAGRPSGQVSAAAPEPGTGSPAGADFDDGIQPAAAKPPTPPYTKFFPPTTVTESMTITPVLTPDPGSYATHLQALIASAQHTLYLQFQYIELPQPTAPPNPAFTALVDAVIARQNAGLDVRIIMSEYETQGYLEQLMTAGLHVATVAKIQNNVHNKGVIIDAATVLVSSQNWSSAGTTTNRDAGVIINNPTLAAYYQQLFLHDWNHLATTHALQD